MIRVLHVIDHLDLGGAQTALLDMLRHRDRCAFDIEVAVMHGRGPFAEALEALGIKVHSLSRAKWPPDYVAEFVRLLRRADFEIVHFHLQGANWIAKPLAALVGQRILIAHDHTSGDLRFRGAARSFRMPQRICFPLGSSPSQMVFATFLRAGRLCRMI